ncbi:(d)CMP kinase [Ethanoligenens harbinense]|uniref:Cytidylate kinase n=1 Tax=Ethanoligenens harbinense (strain DSM 18485 / JCM 12961 / CGMCC 1.5033 / YUAN-3) TaxID=663278 RepID=E6U7H4_ETHHY|nr:(d)CMP kinase [Ethanoligenens harbinense]ADU26997.1 cytidylate kinase [Ethanoligenens harbinense YUAN-3]AVQ96085.1 (d)CMP kinase [Ethanoligenens harbinense YUAN-3]AYF38746.1 (d)CMP kinase [Ethanoligenens harbinense]AYF41494.1 (d)CMP kinase [Ethanoligenens harbinense]QCN92326.1 (d)CMP kinase [Ethanoligenens harbinense]
MYNIAIDGPAGAGKSTLSRMLADRLGFVYADTGALYRAVGLFAVQSGVSPQDAAAVEQLLPSIRLELALSPEGQCVLLCGKDVSAAIRAPEISKAASQVSAIPAVRAFLLGLQQKMAQKRDIVMDGRDIGTVVLPHAQLKIFLTATPEDRARRRHAELREKGTKIAYEQVLDEVKERDAQDSGRAIAPLRPAEDALIVDTTGYELEDSLERLYQIAKERLT